MGIDYSSATAYGFVVDQEKLESAASAAFEDGGPYEALEGLVRRFPSLSYDSGHGYDAPYDETDFAVVISSTHQRHGGWHDPFGVFVLADHEFTDGEADELRQAYALIGQGEIGPLAIFRCS